MWVKILASLAGVLIDKLILPLLSQLGKKWARANAAKDRVEKARIKAVANAQASEKDTVRDTFGDLP
jgi:hypothetical protein